MPINILYIWDADYPWDVRVEKICMSLKRHGYAVHIAARNLRKQPKYEQINGMHIHRLKPFQRDSINYLLSFPAFFSPVWKSFLDSIISRQDIKVIIVRDLPLAVAGIWAGKRHGIPVIFDMAEDYVAMIKDIWKDKKFSGLNLLVRNPYLAKHVAKYVFRYANQILVVVEEAIDVVMRGGGNPDKISIVGNTPKLASFYKPISIPKDVYDKISSHYSAIYTGGIQNGRGIQIVLESIPEIIKTIPEFLFVIVGDGYASGKLKDMVREKSLEENVLWVGLVPHEGVYGYIKACKVGVIPHYVTDHVNTTIPNKIFDYMGCGIPIVASDAIPITRILGEEKAGIVFKSGSSEDLSKAIKEIYLSTNNYGQNGITSIISKYNWDNDFKRLTSLIDNLLDEPKNGANLAPRIHY
jgi:glycosyltransferase involved in cell wall biosynthesis